MSQIPPHFQLDFQPVANPDAVVIAGSARFTLLTSRLIRLEHEANGRFQNNPSQPFWYRNQPVPPFEHLVENGRLYIETDHLLLIYKIDEPFSANSLHIRLKKDDTVWHFGDKDPNNLRGTTRTLDQVSGSTPLEPGLLSRSGWAVVDDSHTLVFNPDGWLEPRHSADALDLYFFGYGHDYAACLRDYSALTGPVPLLPRWALGNWWSRYWAYTQAELTQLMADFRAHDVPLSVCIIDMDWHLAGWTGYTWNRDLFPQPEQFLDWLHEQGLKSALNLHPADGVGPHEAQYAAMAQRLGQKADGKTAVPFNIANPELLDLHCFAGASGEFTLYEDDGESLAYQKGSCAFTQFRQDWLENIMSITIQPVSGDASHIPAERSYCVHLRGISASATLTAWLDGQPIALNTHYDESTESWLTEPVVVPASSEFRLTASGTTLRAPRDRLPETIDEMLHAFRLETLVKAAIAQNMNEIVENFDMIRTWQGQLKSSQHRALAEIILKAGTHKLPDFAGGGTIHWGGKQKK